MDRYHVIVVGLDGATFDLIKPWASSGNLPTFARLMAGGAWGNLQSTIPPMTAPAWTSFMTGKNPGKHGLYDWTQREDTGYDIYSVNSAHCLEPPLWMLLSSAGRRVCVLNVPMTFPPYPVNGVLVSGLPAPSTRITISYPSDLLQKIEQEVGIYQLYPDPGQAYSDTGVDAFLNRLYRTTETRLRTLAYLRSLENWDFCMAVINGTDTIQHAMWKFMDPEHPLHIPAKRVKYGEAILEYYRYVDRALGEIVNGLRDDTVLILMSDHGFGPFYKFIHVNQWLLEQGWLRIKTSAGAQLKKLLFGMGVTPMHIYDLIMSIGLGSLKREVVRGRGQSLLKSLFLSFDEVDWAHTRAYSLGNVGQIRINVAGREPQGFVKPGKQYDAVREEIIHRLWELHDPETGEQVVEKVYKREELYFGSSVEKGPDIIFIPTRMEYFGFGEYEFGCNQVIQAMRRGISGTHRLNGMFLLWGKPVQPGVRMEGTRIMDLAPTILHLMGEPVPSSMDGQVLTGALLPEMVGRPSYTDDVSNTAVFSPFGRENYEFTEEDKEILNERMRDLGYMA